MKKPLPFLFVVFILLFDSLLFAQTGKIVGRVFEYETGDPLPGANIYIPEESIGIVNIGTSSGIDGEFYLTDVPVGDYVLIVNYLGYKERKIPVKIEKDKILKLEIEMKPEAIEGEVITVTAQASGQRQAINQQLNAKNIVNVVSSKTIRELPENNAAEAVGRLPGVSLERQGGEGTKVVIRGMAPKYSLIQIEGVNMAATGEGDRSADLSMISPYMLEGIELSKSIMANQEASATGGIVNFRIKKAPLEPTFNVITQGGYNDLRGSYNNYKISVGGSNRFFSDALGIYAQVDYEKKDVSSQQLGGITFSQENENAPVKTHTIQLMDIFRNIGRLGGTVVLDYSTPATDIKLTNFLSRINVEETRYQNNYNFTQQGFSLNYTDTPEKWLTIMTNSLQIDHQWKGWEFNTLLSHSYSKNVLPAQISSTNNNSPNNPFPTDRDPNFNVDLNPEDIPHKMILSMDEVVNFMHLGGIYHEESETQERDLAAELNIAYKFDLAKNVNIKLSVGGKYKHKSKDYDRTVASVDNFGGDQEFRDLVYYTFENELSQRTKDAWMNDNMRILLIDFLDKNYKGKEFLNGKYDFGYVFDKEKFRRIHDLVMATYDPYTTELDPMVEGNFIESNYSDYFGFEDYYAFYIMPEVKIGSDIMIIPGLRYEANRTEYTGYRGNRLGVLRSWTPTPIDTVTKVRTNEFWLPMIQAFYKPTDWLTIKGGYTNTLQRPNYNQIMPGWVIQNQGEIWNLSNFRLRPELSRNWDLQFAFHSDKVGLLSVGAFYKKITDMIFWTGQKVITDTAYFELPSVMNRKKAAWATNNPYDVVNYGFELEWQSNFWYLPGILKGLVVNVNYTRNISEAEYLKTRIKQVVDPITYRITLVNEDTTYKAPMILQPDHVLNFVLGFDYKGFSIRSAVRFSSHVFKYADWYDALRGYSTDYFRLDLAIRQKLPIEGLEIYLNMNNLTGEVERDVINHMNFTRYMEDYGRNGNIGLRYQF